jgi:hypothetical protein
MDTNDKIKMIGLTPSLDEQTKINFIAEIYHLTNTGVLKNLMYNKITLNEFYERARKYDTNGINNNNNSNTTDNPKDELSDTEILIIQ